MFRKIPTSIVGMIRGLSRLVGYEIDVVITPHTIELEFVDPDSSARAWDETHFTHGNIHFEGFANPVKPQVPDTEDDAKESQNLELIASDRYKEFMEQNLIGQIIDEGKPDSWLTVERIGIMLATLQVATIAIVLYVFIA